VQIAQSIYAVEVSFFHMGASGVAGTRASFPFVDITDLVDDLVCRG
jgi:hypothetical protein